MARARALPALHGPRTDTGQVVLLHAAGSGALRRQRKLTHYHRCLELLEDLLTDSPLVKQLRIELESITSSPREHPVLAG